MVMIKEKIDDPWRGFLKYWDQILWNYFYTDYVVNLEMDSSLKWILFNILRGQITSDALWK